MGIAGAPPRTDRPAHRPGHRPRADRAAAVPPAPAPAAGTVVVDVPLGQRAMVLGDLLLPCRRTASSTAVVADVAQALASWQGPGVVVICGNLFDLGPADAAAGPGAASGEACPAPAPDAETTASRARQALEAHGELTAAINDFTGGPGRRLLVLPGWRDAGSRLHGDESQLLAELGAEVVRAADLHFSTAGGVRRVEVRAGAPAPERQPAPAAGALESRPWLTGVDRLEDPAASRRLVTSRMLYRRLRRYLWVPPLVVAAVALLIRLPFVFHGLSTVVRHGRGQRVLSHAYAASWTDRLLFVVVGVAVLLAVVALLVAVSSRGVWRALGGGELPDLPTPFRRRHAADRGEPPPAGTGLLLDGRDAIDEARRLVGDGGAGLVVGGSLRAELTQLDRGFLASPGGTTELVREHRGRMGLPPVFLPHRQTSWLELEGGAELHVRLLLADADLPGSTLVERLVTTDQVVKGYKGAADLHPSMVASWPRGASWPPAADVAATRVVARRVRRIAAGAIFVAGLADLLSAVTPPLRAHLREVTHVLGLGVAQAAGALVALAGLGLMMLARGVLRGQRRAWLVSVALLVATVVLHLLHDAKGSSLLVPAVVLLFLLVQRRRFRAVSDAPSSRSAFVTVAAGVVVATVAATVAVELSGHIRHHPLPAWWMVLVGSGERLVGLNTVAFPDAIDDFVAPSLLAVGVGLALVALYFLTRPVVDRQLSSKRDGSTRRAAELRARDIVRRHGSGTLDYFALRDDKQWFFHRDSMVAYAVYGGVCLVSPDPIGPMSEREHVWSAFRHHADRHGWAIGIMGSGEEWLPIYRASGMRYVYIGDEAVVSLADFSLSGGKMKGLRQAVNRVERHGYSARFFEPPHMDPAEMEGLAELMGRHTRGEHERGFSMTLGRLFDPRDSGVLLTVVHGPEGRPVAMCQFVPSPAIGGYSLDLMRRDPGEHPNGLLDFALCATIEHVRQKGGQALSLNFAAMRSVLEGESGDGLTQRVERWAIRRLSGVLQIESLWRFNAKYEPGWLPRYICYDSAEQFVPTAVQIMRAESLTEIPVVGRLLGPPASRRGAPAVPAGGAPGHPAVPAADDGPTEAPQPAPAPGPGASDPGGRGGPGAGPSDGAAPGPAS